MNGSDTSNPIAGSEQARPDFPSGTSMPSVLFTLPLAAPHNMELGPIVSYISSRSRLL